MARLTLILSVITAIIALLGGFRWLWAECRGGRDAESIGGQTVKYILLLLLLVLLPIPALAATLSWDRNSEPDMKDYQVRQCLIAGCTVALTDPVIAVVLQPAIATRPSVAIDIAGKTGAFTVSARDATLNESGLSVQVPFDQQAPLTPVNPTLQ